MRHLVDDRTRQNATPARHLAVASTAEPTSSVVLVRALAAAVAASGADAAGYLADLGLAAPTLDDVEARLPTRLVARAWELAAARAGDPSFGLHLVERAPAGSFDVLEYAIRACATFGAALEHMARYYRLLEDAAEIAVETDGAVARLVHRPLDPRWVPPRHGVEATLCAWVLRAHRLGGDRFELREAFFRHAAPVDVAEHPRVFRAPLRFDAAASGITFDRAWLDAPQPTADATLMRILDRQADALLARLPVADGMEARARRSLVRLLPGGSVSLTAVARSLGTSARSLQRGLAAEGVAFQELVAHVRCHLACGYLEDGKRTIGEISFALGFSAPTAFQRAFRRWTGLTPHGYRSRAKGHVATPEAIGRVTRRVGEE
jgi:AraC-like DNA-binding protein